MKIVIPYPETANDKDFLSLLTAGTRSLGVDVGRMPFREAISRNPDVLWIHWPEYLGLGSPPDEAALVAFERQLRDYCGKGGIVAWMVHNLMPHLWPEERNFRRLYEIVSSCAAVQIHLGHASVAVMQQHYPRPANCEVRVACHGGYRCLLGPHNKASARRSLSLPMDRRILLVFGSMRTELEHDMMITASTSDWYVLCAGRLLTSGGWRRHARRWARFRARRNLRVMKRFIPNEEVDAVVKACDAMLVARTDSLNSGNLFLGLTFGRAVVGPEIGNLSEVLRETGNWRFDPGAPASMRRALDDAAHADLDEVGRRNGEWMAARARWEACGEALMDAVARVRSPSAHPGSG